MSDRSSSPCPEEPSTPRTEGATRLDFIDGFVEVQNTDGTPLFQFRASALLVSPALVRHLQSTQSTPSLQPWSPATPSTPSPASGVHRVGNTRDQRGAGIAPYSRPRGGSQLASPAAVASLSKGDPFLVTPAASMSGSSTQQTRSHMAGPPTSAGAFVPAEVADIRVSNVSIVKTPKPPNAGAVSRWRKTRPPHESDRRNMILALIGVYVETMGCILCDLRGGDFSHPDSMCPIPFNYADPGYLRFLQEVGFPGPPSCKYCWLPMKKSHENYFHPYIPDMAWCPNYDLPKRVLYELYLHRNGTFKDICADLERHNVPAGTFEDMTSLSECLKMTKRDSKITPAADVLIGLADRWLEGDIRAAIGDH